MCTHIHTYVFIYMYMYMYLVCYIKPTTMGGAIIDLHTFMIPTCANLKCAINTHREKSMYYTMLAKMMQIQATVKYIHVHT